MIKAFQRSGLIVVLLLSSTLLTGAQKAAKAAIDERSVRAHMSFLAGDAMQGRGSGTVFERIAAEYVGSQFMQFGLEPAGDPGFDGKPSFVQTVTVTRNSFEGKPTLRYGPTTLEHGGEMAVIRANAAAIGGELHKIGLTDTPKPGAVVLVRESGNEDPNSLMQAMQRLTAAGASIVLVEESPAMRSNWQQMSSRRLTFTISSANVKPAAMVVLSKDAAAAVAALTDGTRIDFAGKLAGPQVQRTWNAAGTITGTERSSEVILLSSHLDHLGIRENAPGPDKIFNGADDDASGTVAVIELARHLAAGKKPKRTIYFVCFGSEESGGLGSNHFVSNMQFPKENLVANLQFEMIGRPDAKVKPDELWLTGFERSDLGPELARQGARLVQDPHPDQNFFRRSDNYTLARQGVIAHTVSSFGLHTDYHRASDELKTIDFAHMTRSIDSMLKPIVWLANSVFKPAWNEGMKP